VTADVYYRSIVPGAYLLALLLNGRFDPLIGLIFVSIVLIWAVPQLRRMLQRREGSARDTA
jgi:hypothetical protein